jgi:transposase
MTSIKVKFNPSTASGHEGNICYQIIHDRKVRQLATDYRLFPEEWNEKRSTVIFGSNSERKAFLLSLRENIRRDMKRFGKIRSRLDAEGLSYSADDIINEFKRFVTDCSLFNFAQSIIAMLKHDSRLRTAETYKSALMSFSRFRNNKDIVLDCITSETMESYEAWLKNRGVVPNTISFYMRILRAVYNRAVEKGMIENLLPFRKVYTGIDKTVKRALPISALKKIKSLNLSQQPSLDYARDMFLLSFCLRGMSFIDMAYLKKSDLKDGYVTYRRRKTGQQLIIQWTNEMQLILNKYPENESIYLLPIIRNSNTNTRCICRNKSYNINHSLKKIAGMTGVNIPLTLYVARHSWASAAKTNGVPVSVISEGMGHDSESTTRIYLASLDTSLIDRANTLILNSLK